MWKIEVSNAIVAVETYEEFSITYRDVSGHPITLSVSQTFYRAKTRLRRDRQRKFSDQDKTERGLQIFRKRLTYRDTSARECQHDGKLLRPAL
jgi:hypothetical protein